MPLLACWQSDFHLAKYSYASQVMCELCRPDHPMHIFTWGNTRSLKELPEAAGVPVRDELYKYVHVRMRVQT